MTRVATSLTLAPVRRSKFQLIIRNGFASNTGTHKDLVCRAKGFDQRAPVVKKGYGNVEDAVASHCSCQAQSVPQRLPSHLISRPGKNSPYLIQPPKNSREFLDEDRMAYKEAAGYLHPITGAPGYSAECCCSNNGNRRWLYL